MKRIAGLMLVGALFVGAASSIDTVQARSCYRIWVEVEANGSRYRHIVYVKNECDEWLECAVWTNDNPQPPKYITVGPGATESEETSGDAEDDEPRAFGRCHRK